MWWLMVTRVQTLRCPSVPCGGHLPRSTSWRCWRSYEAVPAGEKGAVLRREGLYSGQIVEWRRARDGGALAGLTQPRAARSVTASRSGSATWNKIDHDWSRWRANRVYVDHGFTRHQPGAATPARPWPLAAKATR